MALSTSTTTLMAVFEDYSKAQEASRELVSAGIPQDAIHVESNFRTGTAGIGGSPETSHHEESGFMGWWHRTFGGGDEAADRQEPSSYYNDDRGTYAEAVRRGNAVIAVHANPSQVDHAVEILNSAGAIDIDRRVDQYRSEGYQNYDPSAPAYDYDQAAAERDRRRAGDGRNLAEGQSIPVFEEELQVGKRSVQRGGVRVYSRVVEQPVDEEIRLREEHVRVERRPVNRPVNPAELANLRDQSVEITEMAEEPVVSKQARVREEVIVGKETTERTEHIRDNVRRTEVHVDQLGAREGVPTQLAADQQTNYQMADQSSRYQPGTAAVPDEDEYVSTLQSNPRYAGRSWNDIENDVRSDYSRTHAENEWDRVKDRMRNAWNRMTSSTR